jgi:hypothetical protein
VNRKPFRINGVFRRELSDSADLRAAGVNTILCPVTAATASVWERADALGFFVMGLLPSEASALALAQELKQHPSCLAWIADEGHPAEFAARYANSRHEPAIGLRSLAPVAVPPWIRFLAGPALLTTGSLPWLQIHDIGEEDAAAPLGRIRL